MVINTKNIKFSDINLLVIEVNLFSKELSGNNLERILWMTKFKNIPIIATLQI